MELSDGVRLSPSAPSAPQREGMGTGMGTGMGARRCSAVLGRGRGAVQPLVMLGKGQQPPRGPQSCLPAEQSRGVHRTPGDPRRPPETPRAGRGRGRAVIPPPHPSIPALSSGKILRAAAVPRRASATQCLQGGDPRGTARLGAGNGAPGESGASVSPECPREHSTPASTASDVLRQSRGTAQPLRMQQRNQSPVPAGRGQGWGHWGSP